MAATPQDTGFRDEQRDPGSTDTNPVGTSTPAPAEGSDDLPPKQPGSPRG
ncbi:hypothetical protein ACX40Y_14325 [Sphingomonas sp. RS6]